MRVLAIAPLLLACLLAGAGQAAAATAATCPNRGSWQLPEPDGTDVILSSVTVLSACDVWAVGSQFSASGSANTLTEHWTGGPSWTVVPSPDPSADSELTAVRAVSATDIWAVGRYRDSSGLRLTLTEHWDGSAWTLKPSPSPGTVKGSVLEGVAATSPSSAWAVGLYDDRARGKLATLILRWDGSVWAQVDSPSPGGVNTLSAVSATSATNAWAVGSFNSGDGTGRHTLTERWDGSAWTKVDSPSPPDPSELVAVAVTASNNAWAVGSSVDSDGNSHALIERWNGSVWNQAAVPAGASSFELTGVAATSAGNAWAVGHDGVTGRNTVLHWDGSAWTQVSSPATGASVLQAVATTPGGFAWTVGSAVGPVANRLQDVPRIQVVVQGSDAHVYETGPVEGQASTGVSVAAGTSPAAAGDGHGGVEAAWQASGTHHLFTLDPSGHQADTGLSVAAGTSPAVAALPGGGFQIAFVNAADGQTWVLGPGGAPARNADPGLAVAAGTSPSIASNSNGGVKIAVHAAGSDHLWLIGTSPGGTAREIGVALAAGTSPAITAGPTGFSAAFVHAGDSTLWQLRRDGSAGQAGGGIAVAAGTSPAITADREAGFEMAIRAASDGQLWLVGSDGAVRDTDVPVLAGTSPAIAAAHGDFEADVQAPSRDLVTVPVAGPGLSSSVIMAAGSSPAIAATFPGFSIVPNVMGVEQDIAQGWITDAGLTVGTIADDNSCQADKGLVTMQNPVHDAQAAPGTAVNLTVSTGQDAHNHPCIFK